VKRGEIWTVAGGKDYAGEPRPVVIVQDDSFDAIDSITMCAFTTDETDAPLFRLPVQPNERNGLRAICRLMVDNITTVQITKVGGRVGRLDDEDVVRLNQAVRVLLGLAVSPRAKQETVPLCAALYLRVSAAQAEHDVSIPDQERQGEAYCPPRGYQLAETCVEPGAYFGSFRIVVLAQRR